MRVTPSYLSRVETGSPRHPPTRRLIEMYRELFGEEAVFLRPAGAVRLGTGNRGPLPKAGTNVLARILSCGRQRMAAGKMYDLGKPGGVRLAVDGGGLPDERDIIEWWELPDVWDLSEPSR